jgi:hypothetical protein
MKRKGLCLIHERHEIHEKWGCGFVIFVARAFQPEICPAGSLVSGVFLTTEGTEVEWLCGVGGCLVSREAAKGQRGVLDFGVLRGNFAPSPPAPLPRSGGEGWISVASFRFSVFGVRSPVWGVQLRVFASSRESLRW